MVQFITSWTENDSFLNNTFERMIDETRESTPGSNSVVEGHEVHISGYSLYIQMELCRMTLEDAITKINGELNHRLGDPITPIGAFIAMQFFEEIVNGVYFLHSSSPKIIHRDLKPSNIFITDGRGGNYIKIGDFGIATFDENKENDEDDINGEIKTQFTRRCGTEKYMAPEVGRSTIYTEKCDIFSLGCILMDLFCIKKPENEDAVYG